MKITLILVALYVVLVAPSGATNAWARTQHCQKHCGVLTSALAHAVPAELPATMVGGWCPTRDKPNIYTRSKLASDATATAGLRVAARLRK
jgi:hypothetical protein